MNDWVWFFYYWSIGIKIDLIYLAYVVVLAWMIIQPLMVIWLVVHVVKHSYGRAYEKYSEGRRL